MTRACYKPEMTLRRALDKNNGLRAELLRGGLGVFVVYSAGILLNLALAVLLARLLGPEEFGLYSFLIAFTTLLSVLALSGLPALVTRETARAEAKEKWATIKGLWRWASGVALISSVILMAIAAVAWPLIASTQPSLPRMAYVAGLALIPLMVYLRLCEAALRGLRNVLQAGLPEYLFGRVMFILLVVVFFRVSGGGVAEVTVLHILALATALIAGAALVMLVRPVKLSREARWDMEPKAWTKAALPLAFVVSSSVIMGEADKIMLGLMAAPAELGLYAVGSKGAALVAFGLTVVNNTASPYAARLHAMEDMRRLQALAARSAGAAVLFALPLFIAFMLVGEDILVLLFGSAYSSAQVPLAILSVGYMASAATGPSDLLLVMAGQERVVGKVTAFVALANVVLNAALIPSFGANGAALATALSIVAWKSALWWSVRKRLDIDSSILGLLREKSGGQ